MIVIQSARLQLSQFQMIDAQEVFGCITPAIAAFMPWEPPSWSEYVTRCEKRVQAPELGLWLKESAHGQGFGREVVAELVEWGHAALGKESFIYPVAVQNTASRRIAEKLHGKIIGNRTNPKYDSVVYRIPF
jgi:GNAT superfamily N-acetyltransferase